MRIGIDARFFGTGSKGLGRYTQQLILHLERIDSDNEYVIFMRRENWDEYQPSNPRFCKVLADFGWYGLAEQLLFPLVLLRQKCDLMHFGHFNVPLLYRRNFVVTIHDLILLSFPTVRASTRNSWVYRLKFAAYKLVIASAIARAKQILAVSEFTRRDILRHYPTAKGKIVVTHEAAMAPIDNFAQIDATTLSEKYGIIKPYLLYVGNAYPHKNLERLIDAFVASKSAQTHQLVLVGKNDFFYRRLMGSVPQQHRKSVLMLPDVSDVALAALYVHAVAFVFPSLYEGFGLPPLEAMSYGTPVISSNHDCMREILGDAALYFDAGSKLEIAAAIDEIAQNQKLRKQLSTKGFAQVGHYSWERMTRQTREVYMGCEL